ncbi:MAG: hypothetical protein AAF790_13140 [Planctomycetota bacterium]
MRIETRVYELDEETPVSEGVTLFHDGIVYDFRPADARVTIYRGPTGAKPARFILLDTREGQKTELPVDRIEAAMTKLRRWCAMQEDPFLRFAGAPEFEEAFDPEVGELRMVSTELSYRVVTAPLMQPELKATLRSFLDNYAMLHTLLESGLPPDPRLAVNEALFRHGVIPVEVELTAKGEDEPSLRAVHTVADVLSKPDLLRIDQAIDDLASFKSVSNADFQRARRLAMERQALQQQEAAK